MAAVAGIVVAWQFLPTLVVEIGAAEGATGAGAAVRGALWSRAGPTVAAAALAGARTPQGQQFLQNAHATLNRAGAAALDAASVLQRLTDARVVQLTNNPALAAKVLSPPQANALARDPGLAPAMFGRALERLVAIDAQTQYSRLFQYVGRRPGPDFQGLGLAAGRIFDITTYLGQAAHYARPYGSALELILYEVPKAWP